MPEAWAKPSAMAIAAPSGSTRQYGMSSGRPVRKESPSGPGFPNTAFTPW